MYCVVVIRHSRCGTFLCSRDAAALQESKQELKARTATMRNARDHINCVQMHSRITHSGRQDKRPNGVLCRRQQRRESFAEARSDVPHRLGGIGVYRRRVASIQVQGTPKRFTNKRAGLPESTGKFLSVILRASDTHG